MPEGDPAAGTTGEAATVTDARHPLWVTAAVGLVLVVVDQVTKRWALSALEPGSCSEPDACIDLILGVRLHLVFNTGAAFTRGAGYGPLLGVLAFVMTIVLLYLSSRRHHVLLNALYGAVAGGAVGNLVDRLARAEDGFLSGAVVDFIDVGWWPVFNVADSAIVVGVIGIVVVSLFERDDGQPSAPEPPE